jgi:hypothetical protein
MLSRNCAVKLRYLKGSRVGHLRWRGRRDPQLETAMYLMDPAVLNGARSGRAGSPAPCDAHDVELARSGLAFCDPMG